MNPLRGVLGEAWALYRRHADHLLPIAFAVYLVVAVVETALAASLGVVGAYLAFIVALFAVFLLQATLITAVEDLRDGRADLTVAQTLRAAGPRLAAVAGASIVAGVAIAVGLVLFVLPGLVAMTYLALVVPVVVVEGAGTGAALQRSMQLVRGYGLPMFGILAVTMLLYLVAGLVLDVVLTPLPGWARDLLSTIAAGTLLAPFSALALTLSYHRLASPAARSRYEREDLWS